jgi:L-aspartate oxidase
VSRSVDVLIVGAGVAGLSAAVGMVLTRDVLVLSAGEGSTPWAQGGVAAAFGGDDPDDHWSDTGVAGADFCDERHVRILVEEGPQRVADLIALGAVFDRRRDASLSRTLEGGHGRADVSFMRAVTRPAPRFTGRSARQSNGLESPSHRVASSGCSRLVMAR